MSHVEPTTSSHYWVPSQNIVGTISPAALTAEIGRAASKSAMGKLRRFAEGRLVPSHEHLEVGDVILSGYPKKRNGKHRWHPVRQGQLHAGCDPDCCHWTHAMLYVGELHVIESNKPFKLKTGVTLAPLTRDAHNSEFLILRFKDPTFKDLRHDIVRYGLMSPYLIPRRYDLRGALSSYVSWRPNGTRHEDRIFCSEFVLECFAIAGAYLVEDWLKVTEQPNGFFLPANLAKDDRFDRFPMKYFQLKLDDPSQYAGPSAAVSA